MFSVFFFFFFFFFFLFISLYFVFFFFFFFFQAEDGIRDGTVTGVQTCALPISTDTPRLPAWVILPTSPNDRTTNKAANTVNAEAKCVRRSARSRRCRTCQRTPAARHTREISASSPAVSRSWSGTLPDHRNAPNGAIQAVCMARGGEYGPVTRAFSMVTDPWVDGWADRSASGVHLGCCP